MLTNPKIIKDWSKMTHYKQSDSNGSRRWETNNMPKLGNFGLFAAKI